MSWAHPVVVVSPAVAGWAVLRVVTVFPVLAMHWFSLGLPRSPECRGSLRFKKAMSTRLEKDSPRLCATDTLSVQQSTALHGGLTFLILSMSVVHFVQNALQNKLQISFGLLVFRQLAHFDHATTIDWDVQRKCHSYFTPSQLRVAQGVLLERSCKIR